MENEIKVYIKNVYGNEHVYPKCKQALLFARLAGHLTLTPRDIQIIKEMGYKVMVVSDHAGSL